MEYVISCVRLGGTAVGRYLFTGGKVYTASGRRPFCQAIACVGKRVIAVGSESEVAMMADDSFEKIDLAGRALVPAFTDSHIHLVHYALSLANVELDGSSGPEEAAAR
ncbi:MAG: hypothetical protein ACOYES_12950, partial [Bacillota bacterium]